MSFSKDINRFGRKLEKTAEAIFRGTSLDLLSRIVKRTPVDQGTARGNWQIGLNVAPSNEVDTADKNGSNTIASGNGKLRAVKLGDSVFVTNNLPYAGVIEHGGKNRRPHGMVKVTVAEYQNVVNANARKARK